MRDRKRQFIEAMDAMSAALKAEAALRKALAPLSATERATLALVAGASIMRNPLTGRRDVVGFPANANRAAERPVRA